VKSNPLPLPKKKRGGGGRGREEKNSGKRLDDWILCKEFK
jgi:hypothetical protein